MKRATLALAMLGTLGTAYAQSSVTLFGVVDVGVTYGRGDVSNKTSLSSSNNASSRIGFRGVEDLGGGMSAGFWLEGSLVPDTGTGAATTTNNQASGTPAPIGGAQGLTFNRRSTVSLAGSWGELRLGRDVTPQEWNHVLFDPFFNVGSGASQAYHGYVALHSIPVSTGMGPHTRASNTIGYLLPAGLGGFYGQAMHYLGENNSGTPNSSDGTGTGLRLGYAGGPFDVAVATARTTYLVGDVSTTNIGASYAFGFGKLEAAYDRTKSGTVTGKGYLIGGIVPVGAGEFKASYSAFKVAAPGTHSTKKLALGYAHNLSKRTALYANVAHVSNSGGASTALGGAVTSADGSSTAVDIGVRHSF